MLGHLNLLERNRLSFLLATLLAAVVGCGSQGPISANTSKFEVAGDSEGKSESETTSSSEPAEPKANESEESNRAPVTEMKEKPEEVIGDDSAPSRGAVGVYKPPKGPPSVQIKFIKEVLNAPIGGSSPKSQRIDYEDKRRAVIASCEIILANAKATNEEKQFAISVKFQVLSEMSQRLADDTYAQQAMQFAAQLQAKEKGTIENELGITIGVALLPEQFAMVKDPTAEDIKKLVSGYLEYLAEGPLPPMYQPGLLIAKMLSKLGENAKSIEVIKAMVAAFSGAPESPEKEPTIGELNRLLRLYEVDFPAKIQAAILKEEGFSEVDAAIEEVLKGEGSQPEWLQFLYGVGATLEREGRSSSATKLYDRVAKLNAEAKDEKTREIVSKLLANAAARKELVGAPFDFTAEDGEKSEFKLSSLKGRPVVVLFWTARDRGISLDELARIQNVLLESRSAFEVVLVNVDDAPEIFKEFSELQKVPWAAASVRCPDASIKDMESELEKRIGLDQLPFSMLLDAEGKVVANFAQGPRLERLVAELLLKPDGADSSEKKTPAPAPEKTAEPKAEETPK